MSRITVLYYPDSITIAHSLFPLVTGRFRRCFFFCNTLAGALAAHDSGSVLVMRYARKGEFAGTVGDLVEMLRGRFQRVAYFDDSASAAALDDQFLRGADYYYKKQLMSERSEYLRLPPGATAFADRPATSGANGTVGSSVAVARDIDAVGRIRTSWNLGIGSLPRNKRTKAALFRLEQLLGPKALRFLYRRNWRRYTGLPRGDFISARWQSEFSSEVVRLHRQRFLERVQAYPAFRTGKIHQRDYNRELRNAAATLSPFGYGEVCYRDFEAAIFRSCLIKPDMSHVETWPDIYRPHQSYIPVNWDASDVIETAKELLQDHLRARRIAENAFDILSDAYNHLDERVEVIVKDLLG